MVSSKLCTVTILEWSEVGTAVDLTLRTQAIKRSGSRRRGPQVVPALWANDHARKLFALAGCPQDLHASSTTFPQPRDRGLLDAPQEYNYGVA